jgi:hypothetical protein
MPINYSKYPPNWKTEIRPAILNRADNKCERCGVPNHISIVRSEIDPIRYMVYSRNDDCHYINGEPVKVSDIPGEYSGELIKVVLTVAHLDQDINHNDYSNLQSLCQLCHNRLDAPVRGKHAAATRRKNEREKQGQMSLF